MWEDGHAVDDALYSLAMGPDTRVRHYESCMVGDTGGGLRWAGYGTRHTLIFGKKNLYL